MPSVSCEECGEFNEVNFSNRFKHNYLKGLDIGFTGEFVKFICFNCGSIEEVSTLRYQLIEEMR